MSIRSFLAGLAVGLTLTAGSANAQQPANFGPEVRPFISVERGTVALVHVRVLDGTGRDAQSDQTVVIVGNKIDAVGPAASVKIPAGARVLNLPGHTVIPGLIGLHDHMFYSTPQGAMVQSNFANPRLYLGSGVTTVRTTGSVAPYGELNLKRSVEAGEAPGPRIHITAPYVITPGPNTHLDEIGMDKLTSVEGARRLVRYWAEEGAEWIKGYTQLSREIFGAVIDEAHKHGMRVTGHLCSISFSEAVNLGIDNIEHGLRTNSDYDRQKRPDECPPTHFEALSKLDLADPRVQETFRLMVSHHVPMTTTAVNEQLAPGQPGPDARTLDAMAPWIAEQELARRKALDAGTPGAEVYPHMKEIYPLSRQYERAFVAAGGLLAAGVDPAFGALAGFGDQRNLELLVKAGFTVPFSIQVMTLNGARVLRLEREIGSIEPGKLADLVVINGDLGSEPGAITRTVTVFKDGVGYDSAKLIASVKGQVGIR